MSSVLAEGDLQPQPLSTGWDDIGAWRKQARNVFLSYRAGLSTQARRVLGEHAKRRLKQAVDLRQFPILGLYWPIRGEINLRDVARAHIQAGGRLALPVVVERGAPVEFWSWRPGDPMQRGLWNIPIPAEREVLQPDALIVPLVGFDAAGYRLGYGGGYYDRTLAAAPKRPFCMGLGYSATQLQSIYPQTHDIPMNLICTDRLLVQVGIA